MNPNNNKQLILSIVSTTFLSLLFFAGLSFIMGITDTAIERIREDQELSGCQYKSYASMYNPFYSAGCELLRDRTKTQ